MNKIHLHHPRDSNTALTEGLEKGDLERLVTTKVTVDEYKSKMGSDDDIVVLTFNIGGKEPATDLVNFLEKGYDWVVDADVSSGEMNDGSYLVFVEIGREPAIIDNILEMFSDLINLTGHEIEDWKLEYSNTKKPILLDKQSLMSAIPTTPDEYRMQNKKKQDSIDQLKLAAGVNVDTEAPKNDFTESLRIAAGIR